VHGREDVVLVGVVEVGLADCWGDGGAFVAHFRGGGRMVARSRMFSCSCCVRDSRGLIGERRRFEQRSK
jgi:hypothetical protein